MSAIVPLKDGIYEVQQKGAGVGWVVVAGREKVQSWFLLSTYVPPSESAPKVTTTFALIDFLPDDFASAPRQIQGAMVPQPPVRSHDDVPILRQIEPGQYTLSQAGPQTTSVGSLSVQAGNGGTCLEAWQLTRLLEPGKPVDFNYVGPPGDSTGAFYHCTTLGAARSR